MNRKPTAGNVLKRLPTKWAVAVVFCLIGYSVAQPFVNSKLGWSLPSLASLSGQGGGADDGRATQTERNERGGTEDWDQESDSAANENSRQDNSRRSSSTGGSSNSNATPDDSALSKGARSERGPPASSSSSGANLRYGLLKDLGGENYLSPAGLRYTKGSEEGHRLKHVGRHLEDQPTRPSPHGVFYGDMQQVLR